MPFFIEESSGRTVLKLEGSVTVRDAQALWSALEPVLGRAALLDVDASRLDDIDSSLLQVLCSAHKTAADFRVGAASRSFFDAVERCSLRRDFGAAFKWDELEPAGIVQS
jgi:anti-anti-sigma regulatory factor